MEMALRNIFADLKDEEERKMLQQVGKGGGASFGKDFRTSPKDIFLSASVPDMAGSEFIDGQQQQQSSLPRLFIKDKSNTFFQHFRLGYGCRR